jgi:hypothetical protein
VSAEAFPDWIAPHVAGIRALTVAIDGIRDRHGNLPATTAQAMTEIAEEQRYRMRSGWPQPLTDTHMLGGMTLQAQRTTFAARRSRSTAPTRRYTPT